MEIAPEQLFGLVAALAGGLLVGVGRERQKAKQPEREPAGVRSFTLVALIGAVAALLGPFAIAVAGAAVAAMVVVSYWHSVEHDPGVTTELAMLATFLLGAVALNQPQLGAGMFVGLAVLLQSKTALHRFTRQALSEAELNDALLLAAATVIVLPLLPDRTFDPFDVLNPRKLWLFAVLVMGINALGYIALRALGAQRGLPLAGLLGGFVSSAATISGMGQRARSDPTLVNGCIAAALLSCVATVIELVLIFSAMSPPLLRQLALPLIAGGAMAVLLAAWFVWRDRTRLAAEAELAPGRPFALSQVLLFVAIVAGALLTSALLRSAFGESGAQMAVAATGFADVHAAAVTLGQLVAGAALSEHNAVWGLAAAFTANSCIKCLVAVPSGRAYASAVILGVVAINAALVAGVLLS